MRRALLILALALAGCGNGTEEAAKPTPSPSPTPDAAKVLETVEPCGLLDNAERRRLDVRNDRIPQDILGQRTCRWMDRDPHKLLGSTTVAISILKGVGLDTVKPRVGVPPFRVGSHDAIQYKGSGSFCVVALGITDRSRVDVMVEVAANIAKACDVSRVAAGFVEPRLP